MPKPAENTPDLIFVPVPRGAEGAIAFFAWIAFPGSNEKEADQRSHWRASVVATAAKAYGRHLPPGVDHFDRKDAIGVFNRGRRRILDRRLPATVLAAKLMEGKGLPTAIREVIKMRSHKQVAGPNEARIVRSRIWTESLPAIAMAWALSEELIKRAPNTTNAKLDELIWRDHEWADRAADCALSIAPRLLRHFRPLPLLIPLLVE